MGQENKIKTLYEGVSKDYDIGTLEEFTNKLKDPTKRQAFFNGVGAQYDLGDYKTFEGKILPELQPAPVEKKSPVQPTITKSAATTVQKSAPVSQPVIEPSPKSGEKTEPVIEPVVEKPLTLLEQANKLFGTQSNESKAEDLFAQGQVPKEDLKLKSGPKYAFEQRVFTKAKDSNNLKERAANKFLEVQKNEMFPQLAELQRLEKLRAEAAIGRGVEGAGVSNLDVIQQQIDALKAQPVQEAVYGMSEDQKPLSVKSPYKTVGELADGTAKAKEEFANSVKGFRTIDAELQPVIERWRGAKGFVPNKTDANGNKYYEVNPMESFTNAFVGSLDVMGIGMKNLFGDKEGAQIDMQKKYVIDNVLEPKRTDGAFAKGTEMLGGVAPLIVGSVASGGGLGGLAAGALLFGAQDYGGTLYGTYTEGKMRGLSDEQAMAEANKGANFAGLKGMVLGGTLPAQGALGRKVFLNNVESGAFKSFLAEQGAMVPAFGSSTALQNWYQGKPISEGVEQSMLDAFIIGGMTHAIASFPKLPAKTKAIFENAIAKNFEPLADVFNKGVQEGAIDFSTAQRIQEKSEAFDLIGRNNPPAIEEALLDKGERLNLLNKEAKRRKDLGNNFVSDLEGEIEARKKDILEIKGAPLTEAEQKSFDRLTEKATKEDGDGNKTPLLPGEKEELRHFTERVAQNKRLAAAETKRVEEEKKQAEVIESPVISINEVIDEPVLYKGQKAIMRVDGDMVIAKVGNKEYEIGKTEDVSSHPIKDYGIEQEHSVVTTSERGNIVVRGDEYFNNYSNPLSAINYDADGNVVSVNLETHSGKKRAFRGDIAEDVAYQLTLKELADKNEVPELEKFINEDGNTKQEIDAARHDASSESTTTQSDEQISRQKAERLDRTGGTVEVPGGERTNENNGVDRTNDATGETGSNTGNVEANGESVSKESGTGEIPNAEGDTSGAVESKTITPEDIHAIAEEAGVKWDGDKEFMAMSKKLTGKEHLDEMTPEELDKVGNFIIDKAVADRLNEIKDAGQEKELEVFINEEPEVKKEIEKFTDGIGSDAYKAADHKQGRTITKTVADGSKITGTYKLVSSDDVIASHNEKTFAQSEGYPVNDTGTTINDRDYRTDTNAQKEVVRIAQNIDDRAISQTPVVTKDGIVIDGNNRTMSRKLAAANGTDKAYVEALKDQAELYGFTPEDVEAVKNPMLVFEPKEQLPYDTKTLAKFNKEEKKQKSPVERAVEVAKTISDRARRRLGEIYSEAEKPSDVTSNPKYVKEVVKLLQDEKIVQPNELPRYFDVDKLTATKEGVAFMESLLIGGALDEKAIRLLDNESMGAVKQKIMKAIVPLTQNAALGENSLTKDIEGAIGLVNKAKQEESSVVDAVRQMDMFSTAKFSAEELALGIMLDGDGFGKFLKDYNESVGQEVLFEGKLTKEKIIDNALRQKIEGYEKIRPNLRSDAAEGKGKVQSDNGGGKQEKAPGAEKGTGEKGEIKGKDKIARGLDKLTDALGGKLKVIGEEERPKVIDALRDIAEGLIEEGSATAANIIQKLKEYVKGKMSDEDFDSVKDDLAKEFTPEKIKARADVKKTIVTKRAYEGKIREDVKAKLEAIGLTREIEGHEEANKKAKELIADVGIDTAMDAVKNGDVEGAPAAAIFNAKLEALNKEMLTEKDPEKQDALASEQAKLIEEMGNKALKGGQFNAMFDYIYGNSEIAYNAEEQIKRYKEINEGKIPADVEKRFRELDTELKEVKKKLAEAEVRAKEAEEQGAVDNIKEAVKREKTNKKVYTAKAKAVANEFRKLKGKPLTFKGADGRDIEINKLSLWDDAIEIGAKAIELSGVIADGVKAVIDHISEEDWYKKLTAADKKAFEKHIADQFAPVEKTTGKLKISHALIREAVEAGNENIADVTKYVKDAIKEEYPDATDRDVRDAITGYGKIANPSADEVETSIRKMKRVGRVVSALEDIANKKRPLRSGQQRDKLDAEERALNKELKEAMKDLPIDAETEAKQLKTSLDAIKSRLSNQIEDLTREIETGEKTPKSERTVEYDAEAKALKEERDRLKEEHEQIFGKNELTDGEKLARAQRAVERAIDKINERISNNELEAKKPKELRSPSLDAAKKRLQARKDVLRQMQEDAGIPEKERLETAKKNAQRRIDILQERIRTNDFAPKKPKPIIADNELTRLNARKLAIQEEYDVAHYKNELANRTKWQKAEDAALELVSGLPRALIASIDLSAMGVQGAIRLLTAPKQSATSVGEMFKSIGSEKYQQEWLHMIKSQPWYADFKAAGGHLSEHDSKVNAREDRFISNWVNHVWDLPGKGIGMLHEGAGARWKAMNPYKASERAYNGYLNAVRVQGYLEGVKNFEKLGMTFESDPEAYKAWADYINTSTGRGDLGRFEQASKVLNFALFSPRRLAGLLKLSTPYALVYYGKMYGKSPVAAKMALTNLAAFAGIATVATLFAKAAGADVETDPRSSDFMKIKSDNVRVNFFGGMLPQIVLLARMISGETKSATTGKVSTLGGKYGSATRWDKLVQFFSNKASPPASLFIRKMSEKKGHELTLEDEAIKNVTPMWTQSVKELYQEKSAPVATLLTLMSVMGLPVESYGNDKKKPAGKINTGATFNSIDLSNSKIGK